MSKQITVIRINPVTRVVAAMLFRPSVEEICRVLRTRNPQTLKLCEIPRSWKMLTGDNAGEMVSMWLSVATAVDVDPQGRRWRLNLESDNEAGFVPTAITIGIGLLFGLGFEGGVGMAPCPVDRAWVEKRIEWDPQDTERPQAEEEG